jgi:hypothetical protein
MNLLEEREYYKPFNYPWAFEHYKTQQHMHWLPDEVLRQRIFESIDDNGCLACEG